MKTSIFIYGLSLDSVKRNAQIHLTLEEVFDSKASQGFIGDEDTGIDVVNTLSQKGLYCTII